MIKITKTGFQSVLLSSVFLGLVSCGTSQHTDFLNELENESALEEVEQTNAAYYSCDQKPLVVYFHGDKANIFWQQKNYHLTQVTGESGSLFLGEELSFWVQGGHGRLEFYNMANFRCQLLHIES
ncbi:MliC family protein [Marinomonas transparens]|nr:MliC family protein [Marinomonas transparens]